jgi:hypothetical protein
MAHGIPFRLRILNALTLALAEITPANGYHVDLSGAVFRGRIVYGENDPLPMISILEPPLPPDQMPIPTTSDTASSEWDLLIQGFCEDDPEHPTDPAYMLIADVKSRLAKERTRANERPRNGQGGILDMGGLVMSLGIGPGVVRPADEVSARAYFWLNLNLQIAEDMADSFG